MKKVFTYLRSMRFGILLLVLIALLSVVGTVIPQDREISWYAQTYQSFHGVILMLQLNHVFQSWYFGLLMALLCLNLTLCSLLRVRALVGGKRPEESAARLPNAVSLTPEGLALLHEYLQARRCRESKLGGVTVYSKNSIGRWGTFVTHLSILLTVVFGAAALYLPQVTDQTCLPGESITMPDGARITVEDFTIENAEGRLDYMSQLELTLADGRRSGSRDIRVNHPMSFGPYKIYQQTYGTAGSITVTNLETGGQDDFVLTDYCLLSLDGVNGLWFEALYPGYIRDPSGTVTLITSTSGRYTDPVYQVLTAADGVFTPVLAFPGDTLQVGGLSFTFNDPVEYPGLRIKHTPVVINALLVGAFVLMILGLYATFFLQPVLVKVDETGYAVGGPKPEGTRLDLEELLQEHIIPEKENET